MTADELKFMPKFHFIVTKTGCHPIQTVLNLFFKWGIAFMAEPYSVADKGQRKVEFATKEEINLAIGGDPDEEQVASSKRARGSGSGQDHQSRQRNTSHEQDKRSAKIIVVEEEQQEATV